MNQHSTNFSGVYDPNDTTKGLSNAGSLKQLKYDSPLNDIPDKKWTVSCDTIEIGSLGH